MKQRVSDAERTYESGDATESSTLPLAGIRPDLRYIFRGPSELIVEPDGWAGRNSFSGYFFRQTRFLRDLRLVIRGEPPHLCSLAEVAPNRLELAYIYPEVRQGGGGGSGSGRLGDLEGIEFRDIDITLTYEVRPASLQATLLLTNRWQGPFELDIGWHLSADFATIDEAQFGTSGTRGEVHVEPAESGVRFHHRHASLPLETRVYVEGGSWRHAEGVLRRRLRLPRQETVCVTLTAEAIDPADPIDEQGELLREAMLGSWRERITRVHANGAPRLLEYTNRATTDLSAFAMLEGPQEEWLTSSAGAPLYLTMWGRDALTVGWQAGIFDGGEMLASALARTDRLQGTRVDAERDEEPGRIINQAKLDPLSRLGISPFGRFYADVASPFMFIVGLGYHFFLTGDKQKLRRHWGAALRVLEWADEYGDRDGDGYIEYLTRSSSGPTHQAWKDSENAVVYPDGSPVAPPIASCEIQGYWYAALTYMSALAIVLEEHDRARSLWSQAKDLRERFNRDFWLEDEGFVAFGLDSEKRPIRVATSNAGHCLPTGIIAERHIPRLVRRLFEPDLFSGWGIRTLTTDNPAYNPPDYHLGSVWPVENATIVFGLRRYGLNERALELTRALYDLAQLWPGGRIPECVGGYGREERHHPGAYPRSNAPQAWNQSIWPLLVQCIGGVVPCAPLRLLLVDPILPPWLPELTMKGIRVGDTSTTLRFWREPSGESRYESIDRQGALRVIRQPWLESMSVRWWDRLAALAETAV